ncbi:MAG: salicylate esterase [Gemmatimonadetes bacterium]|nr:salicylate esterase [Gemmatimonadota bacterium]
MKRRSFVTTSAALLGGAALPAESQPRAAEPKTYVLVAGAWFGGWFYGPVAQRLRALGHRVYTPTQTGLGDRRHLLSRDITIDTFVTDVTNLIEFEELRDVILVGHGSGGATVSGVADRLGDQIHHLVFLDALLLRSGQSVFDILPPAIRGEREQLATDRFDGVAFPPPESYDDMGVSRGPVSDWLRRHATPHPLGAFESPLRMTHPVGNRRPVTYVSFTSPPLPTIEASRRLARSQPGWKWLEIGAGHAAPVTAPDDVARLLANVI